MYYEIHLVIKYPTISVQTTNIEVKGLRDILRQTLQPINLKFYVRKRTFIFQKILAGDQSKNLSC